jgi:anaerobic glycerol-3-phosphate dehydrogenase
MSKPINTQIPTAEILMATGVLREVGLDHEADKFRESLFDRDLLPAAVRALEQRIKAANSDEPVVAKEAAFRTYQRMMKITQPR